MRSLILLLILVIPSTSQAQSVPSFSCLEENGRKFWWDEGRICANKELGRLDLKMNSLYQAVTDTTKNRAKLKQEQFEWLKTRRTVCTTHKDSCLIDLYNRRITELMSRMDCDVLWCDRIIDGNIEKILTGKLEIYRREFNKVVTKKINDSKDKYRLERYKNFNESLKKQYEYWEQYMDFTCRPIEEFGAGSGAGDRIRSCELEYLEQQMLFYERVIDAVRKSY
jgi:uncharacterized protein